MRVYFLLHLHRVSKVWSAWKITAGTEDASNDQMQRINAKATAPPAP